MKSCLENVLQTTTKWIKQLRLELSLVVGRLRHSGRLVSQLHIELEGFASNCNVKKIILKLIVRKRVSGSLAFHHMSLVLYPISKRSYHFKHLK